MRPLIWLPHCQMQKHIHRHQEVLLTDGLVAGYSFNAHLRTLPLPWGPPLMCHHHNRRWTRGWRDTCSS